MTVEITSQASHASSDQPACRECSDILTSIKVGHMACFLHLTEKPEQEKQSPYSRYSLEKRKWVRTAVRNNQLAFVQLFSQRGLEIDSDDYEEAVYKGHLESLQFLCELSLPTDYSSLIQMALRRNQLKCLAYLLSLKPSLTPQDRQACLDVSTSPECRQLLSQL